MDHNTVQSARFWSRVQQHDECWLWTGAANHKGYGHLKVGGAMVKAHRFAYQVMVGPIPDGLVLDHLCRNRACVNPAHLDPVTHRVNLLRGETANARRAALTHCEAAGHPFGPDSLRSDGRRECKPCRRDRQTSGRVIRLTAETQKVTA